MTTCAYCEQRATVKIPSNPGQVCLTHALEFWTALFDVVKQRAVPVEAREVPCACGACNELTQARLLSAAAADRFPQSPAAATLH